jgi:hypothetical protein
MIQQCLDLALGRAFTPDPADTMVPLALRFRKRTLIAVSIYKDGIEALPITFNGTEPTFGVAQFCPSGQEDADADFLRAFAERHKAKDCLINLCLGYTAVLSSRTRRPESAEEAILLMRDNPERLLGEPPPPGCRNSLAYHPTHNFAVVFAHKESDLSAAINLAVKAGLGCARIHCGMSSMLSYVLGHFWGEVGKECELLFVERSALLYLAAGEGALGRPLFDVGLKEAALKQAVEERVSKLRPGSKVLLVDSSGLGVAAMIQERSPGATVVTPFGDRPQPFLRACCGDEPQLAYDLFPNEREIRAFAPARLRVVPLIFWGTAAAAAAAVAVNTWREDRAHRQGLGLQNQVAMLSAAKDRSEGVLRDVDSRRKSAGAIYDWLQISPPIQSLLIQIAAEIETATKDAEKENKTVAQVDSLSITRQEGQPQMRLSIVLLGDAPAANRVFARISALFGRLGYSTVDLKQTLVPAGYRYEHLLNMPKPVGS